MYCPVPPEMSTTDLLRSGVWHPWCHARRGSCASADVDSVVREGTLHDPSAGRLAAPQEQSEHEDQHADQRRANSDGQHHRVRRQHGAGCRGIVVGTGSPRLEEVDDGHEPTDKCKGGTGHHGRNPLPLLHDHDPRAAGARAVPQRAVKDRRRKAGRVVHNRDTGDGLG